MIFTSYIALTCLACRSICKVESDFTSLPLSLFKLKNRHWWNSGPKYHRINYVVKVNLGPADVSFELWHNGIKLSKDNSIKVEWQAAAPPDPNAMVVPADFPMSSLPAAGGNAMNRMSNMSMNNLGFGRKPVGNQLGMNTYPPAGANSWEDKNRVQAHIVPVHQNGSTV